MLDKLVSLGNFYGGSLKNHRIFRKQIPTDTDITIKFSMNFKDFRCSSKDSWRTSHFKFPGFLITLKSDAGLLFFKFH